MKFIFVLGVVAALVATTLYIGGDESGLKSLAQGAGPSLVAHWKLDEVTGTTAADSSPNGNDGILLNTDPATDWVPGKIAGALDFDGIDDHVVIANNPSLAITGTEITLAAWIFPRDGGASGGSRIISKRTDPGGSDV